MIEDARILKRELGAEDVDDRSEDTTVCGNSREDTTVTKDGHMSPDNSNASTDSAELEDAWILYQSEDIGTNAHIALGYVPFEMAQDLCEGVVEQMDFDLECGYTAQCDYNQIVRLGNGNTPAHSHVLDIGRRLVGEPMFIGCKSLVSLIDHVCMWAEVEVCPLERVALKGHLPISMPSENMQTAQPVHYTMCLF